MMVLVKEWWDGETSARYRLLKNPEGIFIVQRLGYGRLSEDVWQDVVTYSVGAAGAALARLIA